MNSLATVNIHPEDLNNRGGLCEATVKQIKKLIFL